jgi:putative tryptophan/tyrosine transport system substrate-binding protein
MRRREFIAGLGSATVWPLVARAQQPERIRRIGVLLSGTADDPAFQARLGAFTQGLQQSGWSIGSNVVVETRWATTNVAEIRKWAAELVGLTPDVILAGGGAVMPSLLEATHTVPIVFAVANDPVSAGFVESLAHPGGNATGFMLFDEYRMAGKWLELLKQVAPSVARAAILRDAASTSGTGQLGAIQALASTFRMELSTVNMRQAGEIESAIAAFARSPNGGLIVTASAVSLRFRDLIVALAARHSLPAVYWSRLFVASGGLVSFGADQLQQYRLAASYVDRILKGERPGNLPVQAPTKYETVLNTKTARAFGLAIPETLLATADEVIQ